MLLPVQGVSPEAGKAGEVQASSGLDEAKRPAGGAGAADEKASNSPKMPLFGPMLSPKQPGELTVEVSTCLPTVTDTHPQC